MGQVPVYTGTSGGNFAAASTFYLTVGDCAFGAPPTLAATGSTTYFNAGTLRLLRIEVSANSTVTTASTITSMIAGIAGNMTVSIPAGSVGEFSDNLNSDVFSVTSTVGLRIINGAASGTLTSPIMGFVFSASTNTSKIVSNCAPTTVGTSFTVASTTVFLPFGGQLASATEANVKPTIFVSGTLKNASVYVVSNARLTACTVGSRIAGINGNLSISIAGSGTGTFSDTTNSDTLSSAGTTVNFFLTTGLDTFAIVMSNIGAAVVTTDNTSVVINNFNGASTATVAAATRYYSFSGPCNNGIATEPSAQMKAMVPYTLSKLTATVTSNTVSAASTLVFRKNAATVNSSVSITASTTGVFTDASGADNVLDTDELTYRLVTGSTGTSLVMQNISAFLSNLSSGLPTNLFMMMGVGT